MSKTFEIKQKALYRTFQPIFCPALQETVYFNADGFHHLLFEDRRPRIPAERHYRLSLLPHVHDVISNSLQAKQEVKSVTPRIVTWSLSYKFVKENTNGKHCTTKVVVIRKKPAGRIYFLSVMCQRKCVGRKKFLGFI